jgi:hypothetical protein
MQEVMRASGFSVSKTTATTARSILRLFSYGRSLNQRNLDESCVDLEGAQSRGMRIAKGAGCTELSPVALCDVIGPRGAAAEPDEFLSTLI